MFMQFKTAKLRDDVEKIWRAGVAAVLPERLIPEQVHVDGERLIIRDDEYDLRYIRRIAIVGAGKAAGAMGIALEQVLGPQLLAEKDVQGWINVPADCVMPTQRIRLHAARPAGMNEPRPEGVEGTRCILEIVEKLTVDDLCICVLTGGGSALLPAPVQEITLDEKLQLTKLLSAAGANIEQLNTVRSQLSTVKCGGLARHCGAGQLVTLLISDVLGDRLDIIASGPTVESKATATDALQVLDELRLTHEPTVRGVVEYLRRRVTKNEMGGQPVPSRAHLSPHHVLGNNAAAVDAAGVEAELLGYSHAMTSAAKAEGAAEDVGRHLARMAVRMRDEPGPDCLISGGEPTVMLVEPSQRGRGGRNQQLCLAALETLGDCHDIAFLSAGTDGEDGPTDAAGAIVTDAIVQSSKLQQLKPHDFFMRNDAYTFFQETGGLFRTGPTHTNVCDLRVIAVNQR